MKLASTALVSLSEVCSIGCKFCFRADVGSFDMPIPVLTRTLSRLAELGVKNICFTGGEPTHHTQFLQAVRAVRQFGLGCSVITSAGSSLGRYRLKRLSHLMQHVTLSVDSEGASKIGRTIRSLDNAVEVATSLKSASASINFVFYDLSPSEAQTLAMVAERQRLSIELSPLLLSSSMRLRASINDGQYISTLRRDIASLSQYLQVSDTLLRQLPLLESQVFEVNHGCLCACNRLFVSPRGELRTCPYSSQSISVWATRKELRKSLDHFQMNKCIRQLNCLFYCASETNDRRIR